MKGLWPGWSWSCGLAIREAPLLLSWLVLDRGCGLPVDNVGEGDGIGADMPGIIRPEVDFCPSDGNGRDMEEVGSQLVDEGRERDAAGCAVHGCKNCDPCQWLNACPSAAAEDP